MAFEQIRFDRPLSRIELAALVIFISICAAALLQRLAYMEAVAEARSLDLTLGSIRTGIMINVATRLIEGNHEALASLSGANPVGTVIEAPAGYIGALRGVNPAYIQPGQWYFDEDDNSLVYHVTNTDYVERTGAGPVRLRLSLKLSFDDRNGNGTYDPGTDNPQGVSVNVPEPLRWKF